MTLSKIYVAMPMTDSARTFITPKVHQEVEALGDVIWADDVNQLSENARLDQFKDVRILITGWGQVPCTEEYLNQFPNLELIAHTGGSVAIIGTDATYARGIRVTAGNDVFAESVAEATLAYILAALREIPYHDQRLKQGLWREEPFYNEGLFERRIGLVGFGAIPRFLIPMLAPFKCQIEAYDPFVDAEDMAAYGITKGSLESVIKDKDIVSLHLPLTPETVGTIDDAKLQIMEDRTLIVNTARGAVMDELALADHLNRGRLRAVLDVFSKEPLDKDHPLRSCPRTILIPHMGGPTLDRRQEAARSVLRDIDRYLNGQPMHHEVSQTKASRMTRSVT